MEWANLIVQILIAVGTIGAVIVALGGDWIRSKLASPDLILVENNLEGAPTLYGDGHRAMFYTLRVENRRRWLSVRNQNCRVLLIGLSRRDPSDNFQPEPLPFPGQFVWTPAEFTPPIIEITREQVLDFGYINENDTYFIPRLYASPIKFERYVIGPNEAVQYQLQIEAANFTSPIYVVEVTWNGQWSFDPNVMKRHLPVNLKSTVPLAT